MSKHGLLCVLGVALLGLPAQADGPYFDYLGAEDLGGGSYRHSYLVRHQDNPFVEFNATDFHLDGQVAWDPGTVTVEGPPGWQAEYDGMFYHWRAEPGNPGVFWGDALGGFTITVDNVTVTDSLVNWTYDPMDDGSVFASVPTVVPIPPQPGPYFDYLGYDDLGDGRYRHNYQARHEDFIEINATDFHVDGKLAWDPGEVLIESPQGWTGEYDGAFYHWRMEPGGSPVIQGTTLGGFSITVTNPNVTDTYVSWTYDPQDDQSVFATVPTLVPTPGPYFDYLGYDDLGDGRYRHNYQARHEDFIEINATDFHVDGKLAWDPGEVLIESPQGWTGEYDGAFYHWRMEPGGSPVIQGTTLGGFSITVTNPNVTDTYVTWTYDPQDDQSVFATVPTLVPTPGPYFDYLGYDDLGDGRYRHNYQARHEDFIEINATDFHVDGKLAWDPGEVLIESPQGWTGEYDGVFYHWRMEPGGSPVIQGTTLGGFSITVTNPNVTDTYVSWTYDPQDDQSVFATVPTLVPTPGPYFDYLGYDDLGDGRYRHNYQARHEDFIEIHATDFHVDGKLAWDPGEVLIESPQGWTGEYDGAFYHWRMEPGGSPVIQGTTLGGFSITVTNPNVTDTYVTWTYDPQDDQSVFATVPTLVPTPGPYFDYLGFDDLGDGRYRHNYQARHEDFIEINATDFHVDGKLAWDPGEVLIESPQGWTGEYDGAFYHWRMEPGGSPVIQGTTLGGFSITVHSPTVTDTYVTWTYDPQDDQSVFATVPTLVPTPGPYFDYLGYDDLGDGRYRHNYQARHEDFIEINATDFHVDGKLAWDPGEVLIESPQGWTGEYDGAFYHWRMEPGGSPVIQGTTLGGFSITVHSPTVTDTYVTWTYDPQDDNSVLATVPTSVPTPGGVLATLRVTHRTLNLRSEGLYFTATVDTRPYYPSSEIDPVEPMSLWIEGLGPVLDQPPERTPVEGKMLCSFLRSEVQALSPTGEAIEFVVTGRMIDGHDFTGTDHIRVIDEGLYHTSEDDPSSILDDAIRGEIPNLGQLGEGDLGPVVCLSDYLSNYDFSVNTDPVAPPTGTCVFYLYRFCGGTPTCSYGQTSVGHERTPSSGDCP